MSRWRGVARTYLPPRARTSMLVLLLCAAGCSSQSAGGGRNESGAVGQGAIAGAPAGKTPPSSLVVDAGDFKLHYAPRKGVRKGGKWREVGRNQEEIGWLIAELNGKIALPFDINISLEDCPDPEAFYDPETHQVTICNQIIDEYNWLFSRKVRDRAKLEEAVKGATVATFFHELGHALVDAWKLPITGREEDAVDQLSMIALLDGTEKGERMALDGAISFALYAAMDRWRAKVYWDEYSLNEQRFYDSVRLIYGSDPEKYEYLIKDGTLPAARAEVCQEEYERVNRSWRALLAPYLKGPPQSSLSQATD